MRETVRNHSSLRLFLQAVISDRSRRLKRFFQVALFEDTFFVHLMSPDTREAVGLKFKTDRELIGFLGAHLRLQFLNLRRDAEQILDMVSDFVRQHVT